MVLLFISSPRMLKFLFFNSYHFVKYKIHRTLFLKSLTQVEAIYQIIAKEKGERLNRFVLLFGEPTTMPNKTSNARVS